MKGMCSELCDKNFKWSKRKKIYYTDFYQKAIFQWVATLKEVLVLDITMPTPVHRGYRLEFLSDADIYNLCSSVYCTALVLKQG